MLELYAALNRLVTVGAIEQYAIGGAMAASFYIAAFNTQDTDAFVFLPKTAGPLVSLAPIYDALLAMGGIPEGDFIRIGGEPLQILTDANELIGEAIQSARTILYEQQVPVRVMRAEHLCAIALQTGRGKDYLRVHEFVKASLVDPITLKTLIERYRLESRWQHFEELFHVG